MNKTTKSKLSDYLHFFLLHRGEAKDTYDKVGRTYDDFAQVWDQHIAAPALRHYYQLMKERIPSGAYILDAGAGTGERTQALLQYSEPPQGGRTRLFGSYVGGCALKNPGCSGALYARGYYRLAF